MFTFSKAKFHSESLMLYVAVMADTGGGSGGLIGQGSLDSPGNLPQESTHQRRKKEAQGP